jgi:hypothetical protein
MAFEFGMFHEFQRTAGVTDEEAFATSFEEIDAAERWGLDAMWLAEIHVNPERSVCSAPLTLAGAIAALGGPYAKSMSGPLPLSSRRVSWASSLNRLSWYIVFSSTSTTLVITIRLLAIWCG